MRSPAGLGLGDYAAATLVERLPDLGDPEAPGRRFEETHAQPLLQLGNPAAKLGLRLPQRPARLREATVSNNFGEAIEIVNRWELPTQNSQRVS